MGGNTTEKTNGRPGVIDKLSFIRALRSRGYTLIPLRGKIPAVPEWQKSGPLDFTEAQLTAGNYGVALKAGDLVIDVDPRNFAKGDKPLARLIAAIGAPLNNTFAVRTGGGGLHIYLTKPADVAVKHELIGEGSDNFSGIEFKTLGRQVVGPGSIHPDSGKPYVIVSPFDAPVIPAPAKLLDLIKKTAVPFEEVGELKDYKNDAGTQARFVAYLKESAPLSVEGKQGDRTAFTVAASGRDFGLPPSTVLDLMLGHWNDRCAPPWEAAELEAKVTHAYRYAKGKMGAKHPAAGFQDIEVKSLAQDGRDAAPAEVVWQLTKNGQIVKCFYNLLNYLRLPAGGFYNVFGFNEFTGQVEFVAPAPWHRGEMPTGEGVSIQDKDLALIKGYLAVKHGFEATVSNIAEAVTVVAYAQKFHPVRSYLTGLKWDGRPRIDQWLQNYAGAVDSAYVRSVGRKTLCAAVARILNPGCKFDQVMTLEGPQGAGKSMLCAALGGKWSADFPVDPQNPDTVAAMQGKWFVELAELSVLKRSEQASLKAFITRRTDKVRVAYGRLHQEFPRQCVFIGSINPEADNAYLQDQTGNRRWWPVEVGSRIDFSGVRRDRDQLFAEATVTLQRGEKLYMDTDRLEQDAREIVDARCPEHAWTERISAWLYDDNIGQGSAAGRNFVTPREVFIDAMGGIDKQLTRREILSVASVMRRLGWKSVIKRVGKSVVRGYARPATELESREEVDADLDGLI